MFLQFMALNSNQNRPRGLVELLEAVASSTVVFAKLVWFQKFNATAGLSLVEVLSLVESQLEC